MFTALLWKNVLVLRSTTVLFFSELTALSRSAAGSAVIRSSTASPMAFRLVAATARRMFSRAAILRGILASPLTRTLRSRPSRFHTRFSERMSSSCWARIPIADRPRSRAWPVSAATPASSTDARSRPCSSSMSRLSWLASLRVSLRWRLVASVSSAAISASTACSSFGATAFSVALSVAIAL